MGGYQPTTGDHAANLTAALDQFHQALTRRWREEVCQALSEGREDYPRAIRSTASSAGYQSPWWSTPAWDYTPIPNWRHVQSGTCAYLRWALGGQHSDLHTVSCDGSTEALAEMWTDPRTGVTDVIPPYVGCGMDRILTQVEDWAFAERQHVYRQLPLFVGHDRAALQHAHDTFVELGAQLGLESSTESVPGTTALFRPASTRDIGRTVDWLASAPLGRTPPPRRRAPVRRHPAVLVEQSRETFRHRARRTATGFPAGYCDLGAGWASTASACSTVNAPA